MSIARLKRALTEEQATIINRGRRDDYPLEQSIEDIDLIADITELKMKLKVRRTNEYENEDERNHRLCIRTL